MRCYMVTVSVLVAENDDDRAMIETRGSETNNLSLGWAEVQELSRSGGDMIMIDEDEINLDGMFLGHMLPLDNLIEHYENVRND